MGRARGANAYLIAGFENAYGSGVAPKYWRVPFVTSDSGAEESWDDDDTLGMGRFESDPIDNGTDVSCSLTLPVDPRYTGLFLKAFCGAPTSAAALGAVGSYAFLDQPAVDSTITVNGTVFTFKAAGAAGPQVNIGADIAATVTALAVVLNASVVADVAAATYTADGASLEIEHDTLGTGGNTFTLVASAGSNAVPSGATLKGGAIKHTFIPGATYNLPSMVLVVANPEVPSYSKITGVMWNTLSFSRTRRGKLNFTLQGVGQNEDRQPISPIPAGPAPTVFTYQRIPQKTGSVQLNGAEIADLTGASLTFENSLDVIEAIRADGLISGADAGKFKLRGTGEARYSSDARYNLAKNKTPVEIRDTGYADVGLSLTVVAHRVLLPRKRKAISGEGGVMENIDWRASLDPGQNKVATIELLNDLPAGSYN